MKEPKFGKNAIQSFVEFETTTGPVRFGVEGTRLFFERKNVKSYLTDSSDQMALTINPTAIGNDSGSSITKTKRITLTADNIAAMYGSPIDLVPAKAGVSFEFISAVLIYTRATASFTGGGDISIRDTDATILSNTVTAANMFLNAASVTRILNALNAAGGSVCNPNKALRISNATAAFVKGSATGTCKIFLTYREHTN